MRKLIGLLVALILANLAGTLLAKKGELVLTNGQTLFGEVTETADGYEVTLPTGGATTLAKDSVKSVTYFNSALEAYNHKKSKLAKDDVKGFYELALWAQQNRLPEQMAEAARAVLAVAPDNAPAKLLLAIYERDKQKPVQPITPVTPPTPTTRTDEPVRVGELPKLSDNDVNIIRLLEMSRGERLRMAFATGALDKFWGQMEGTSPEFSGKKAKDEFFGAAPHRQLELIMLKTTPDLHYKLTDMVAIHDDPTTMRTWKTRIHPWMVRSCGASNCHGTTGHPPAFRLINVPSPDTNTVYTNFYVISEFQGKSGMLIDRDKPEESLLLQFALPAEYATRVHPKVGNNPIAPSVKSKSDVMYRTVFSWISDHDRPGGLRFPKLPYHIVYPPPPVPPPPPPAGGRP